MLLGAAEVGYQRSMNVGAPPASQPSTDFISDHMLTSAVKGRMCHAIARGRWRGMGWGWFGVFNMDVTCIYSQDATIISLSTCVDELRSTG